MKNFLFLLNEIKWRLKRWGHFWPYWLFAVGLYPFWQIALYFRHSRTKSNDQNLNILVIPQANRLGDIVCATPVFQEIKKNYPNTKLTVLLSRSKGAWQIIKNNPRIDEVIFYEDKKLIKTLRRKNFKWSVCLINDAFPSLITLMALIPNRIKTTVSPRPVSELFSDWLNNYNFSYYHHTYLPRHYLKLLEPLGIINPTEKKEVFFTTNAQNQAKKLIDSLGWGANDFIVGISLSAGNNKFKEWGDQKFAELAQSLVRLHQAKIIFIGPPNDRERIQEVLLNKSPNNFAMAIDFSIEDLPALMSELKLFIAADTGPIYVASALGVPLVDIVGPVDPREQPPQDSYSLVVVPPGPLNPSSFVIKRPGSQKDHERAVSSTTVKIVLDEINKFIPKL